MSKLFLLCALCASAAYPQDARQIIEELQRRARYASQRYEGILQVIDARGSRMAIQATIRKFLKK